MSPKTCASPVQVRGRSTTPRVSVVKKWFRPLLYADSGVENVNGEAR
jgi:hypothetical protein